MPTYQYVTLVPAGGTPVRLANQEGAPFPTTGTGALVFANSPRLINPILEGVTYSGGVGFGNGTLAAPAIYFGSTDRGFFSTGVSNLSAAAQNVLLWAADGGDFSPGRNLLLRGATSGQTTVMAEAVAAGTITVPAANDTLVARDTVDTLTNKTLTSAVLNTPTINNATFGGNQTFTGNLTVDGTFGLGITAGTTKMHLRGAGSASPTITTAANLGATIAVQDTGVAVNNGGQIIFGAGQGFFAGIKGLIQNGSNNTTGVLSFQTRAATTDVPLTERLQINLVGVAMTGVAAITSSSAAALTVGPAGATNPAFQVNAATASQASGVSVVGNIAAGAPFIQTISSAANCGLVVDAKGTGTITLGLISTGAIILTRATTMSAALTYGGVTLANSVTGTGSMVLSSGATLTNPVVGTQAFGNSSTLAASTAFVQAALAGLVIRTQEFPASGTYTPHANMIYCIIEGVGGGGGGGGAATAGTAGQVSGGAGGGGGEYARVVASKATIGASQPVTIGTAGGGGAAGANAGTAGGVTSVGALLVANGGGNGNGGLATNNTMSAAGLGGTGGTGDLLVPGSPGVPGSTFSDACTWNAGGGSMFGAGGRVGQTAFNGSAGSAGVGFGAGGSGGRSASGQPAQAGGAGTAGYVFITEFCTA
jgi:hypothetical protein